MKKLIVEHWLAKLCTLLLAFALWSVIRQRIEALKTPEPASFHHR